MNFRKSIILSAALCCLAGCGSTEEPAEPVDTTIYPESIEATEPEKPIFVNNTYTIIWKVLPENAENKAVKFSSSNESVATVSDAGVVKGVSKGEVYIVITSIAKNDVSKSLKFYIDKASQPIIG